MKSFYVVIYDFNGKNKPNVIPGSWVYPQKENQGLGTRCYLYHHSNKNAKPPSTNIFFSLIRDASKNNIEDGYVYPGVLLAGFGEY
jgi:hypothetical protein